VDSDREPLQSAAAESDRATAYCEISQADGFAAATYFRRMEHALSLLEPWLAAYGAFALFAVIYLECFGLPLPGESALIAASVLAIRGDLSIVAVVAAAWSGAVLGDTTGYVIGRLGGRPLLMRFGPRIGLTAERFARVADQVRRYSFMTVMLARFVVVVRQLNGLVAGTLSMPLTRFVPANVLGAGLWAGTWGLGPYLFGSWFGLSLTQ
jgi:membrane protein DedA with SNARE-associated domain